MPSFTRANVLGSASAAVLAAPLFRALVLAAPKGDAAADVTTLNTELPLARAAVKAYGDAAATSVLSPNVLAVAKQFAADHQAHADAIVAAIGQAGGTPTAATAPPVASPTAAPATTAPPATAPAAAAPPASDIASLKSEGDILAALYTIERTTAAAYLTALGDLKSRDLTRTTGAILGVVTTHVALLAEALRRGQPYPTSFVTP